MAADYSGVFPVLATPFDPNGQVDEQSLRALVAFTIESGADGLTIGGVASEVYKLSDGERRRICDVVLEATAGRVPVWVGTGHACTELAVEHTKHAERSGAAGVMVMPPYVMKPSLNGVASYFRTISRAVKIPIMIQDAPLVSAVHLPVDFMARLSAECSNVRYVKIEAPPTGPKIGETIAQADGRLRIFGGLAGGNLIDELRRGAVGTLPGSAFPRTYLAICRSFASGDVKKADELHRRILPLIRFTSQSVEFSFHAYKNILKRRGVIAHAYVRQPSAVFDAGADAELDALMPLAE